MISAWDTVVESELEWLGLAAQILEGESVLTGPLLHPSGEWRPGDSVQVVTDDVALESMSEAFQALTTDYRLEPALPRPGDLHPGARGPPRRSRSPPSPPAPEAALARRTSRPGPMAMTVIDTAVGPAPVLPGWPLGVDCLDAPSGRSVRTDVARRRARSTRGRCPRGTTGLAVHQVRSAGDRTGARPFASHADDADHRTAAPARGRRGRGWRRAAAGPTFRRRPPAGGRRRGSVLRPWLRSRRSAACPPPGTTAIRDGATGSGHRPVRWAADRGRGPRRPHDAVGPRARRRTRRVRGRHHRHRARCRRRSESPSIIGLFGHRAGPVAAASTRTYADLVVEPLARSSNPPLPAELDNAVLRGTATPPGLPAQHRRHPDADRPGRRGAGPDRSDPVRRLREPRRSADGRVPDSRRLPGGDQLPVALDRGRADEHVRHGRADPLRPGAIPARRAAGHDDRQAHAGHQLHRVRAGLRRPRRRRRRRGPAQLPRVRGAGVLRQRRPPAVREPGVPVRHGHRQRRHHVDRR